MNGWLNIVEQMAKCQDRENRFPDYLMEAIYTLCVNHKYRRSSHMESVATWAVSAFVEGNMKRAEQLKELYHYIYKEFPITCTLRMATDVFPVEKMNTVEVAEFVLSFGGTVTVERYSSMWKNNEVIRSLHEL